LIDFYISQGFIEFLGDFFGYNGRNGNNGNNRAGLTAEGERRPCPYKTNELCVTHSFKVFKGNILF
jgi:hypothetical protein